MALTPLNATAVAPLKLVPVMVTLVPTAPLVGVKLAIVGATKKLVALVAGPAGDVTLSGPVVAPAGTVVWIAVSDVTVNVALTPLNATAVAPVKLVPLTVTLIPTAPPVGAKLVIFGSTTKEGPLVAVPPGVVTLSGPAVAPDGTVA